MIAQVRTYLAGTGEISAALVAGAPVRVLLVATSDTSPETAALVAQTEAAGARIWRGGPGDLRRMSRTPATPTAMAMLGPSPEASLDELLLRGGITWLVHRAAYPSNVGFVVRTAEVSGADGVIIDAHWNHHERGRVQHVSMGATELMPVLYETSSAVLDRAEALHVPVISIEDVGTKHAHEVDLAGPVVCVIGGERDGIAADVLARCKHVVRVPMAGFVPSYNLQAAMSAVAVERLRQLATR